MKFQRQWRRRWPAVAGAGKAVERVIREVETFNENGGNGKKGFVRERGIEVQSSSNDIVLTARVKKSEKCGFGGLRERLGSL